MTETAVQTVPVVILLQVWPATCYTQIYFIVVINADCRVFTFNARDCLIEIIKDTDSSLDQKAHFYISSWLTGNRICF